MGMSLNHKSKVFDENTYNKLKNKELYLNRYDLSTITKYEYQKLIQHIYLLIIQKMMEEGEYNNISEIGLAIEDKKEVDRWYNIYDYFDENWEKYVYNYEMQSVLDEYETYKYLSLDDFLSDENNNDDEYEEKKVEPIELDGKKYYLFSTARIWW